MEDAGLWAWSPTSVMKLWKRRAGRKCIGRCGKRRLFRHELVVRTLRLRTVGDGGSSGSPADRSESAGERVRDAPGSRGQSSVAAAVSGAVAGGFAGFALFLASLGIYAVISYSVNQRVQEIGIRMALGASATNLQAVFFSGRLDSQRWGLCWEWSASRALTGALESLLFGITPGDPVTFIGLERF